MGNHKVFIFKPNERCSKCPPLNARHMSIRCQIRPKLLRTSASFASMAAIMRIFRLSNVAGREVT